MGGNTIDRTDYERNKIEDIFARKNKPFHSIMLFNCIFKGPSKSLVTKILYISLWKKKPRRYIAHENNPFPSRRPFNYIIIIRIYYIDNLIDNKI